MNNLLALIKVDLKETLDTRKFKENKAKSTSFLTFVVLFLILGIFLSVVYNLMFTSLFNMAGESLVYSTILMAGLTSLLTFSTSVFKVKSIFIGKDYEMLSAMPISKNAIIASKIINLYLLELLYSAIIMIPNMIINIINSYKNQKTHYLGNIVYYVGENDRAGFNEYILVDGQQRITTILLLLIMMVLAVPRSIAISCVKENNPIF